MFLKYRNYAEDTLDGVLNETSTTLTLFTGGTMPDVPFLIYLTAGLTLSDLKTAERVLCYEALSSTTYTVARDWDNVIPVEDGEETTITGSEGDVDFVDLFTEDDIYFRIGNDAYLHRYSEGIIEPPLYRDVNGETARQIGTRNPWSRATTWEDGTTVLMLLGDVNIEELQDANRPYELPDNLEAVTLTLSSHIQIGDTVSEDAGIIKYADDDFWGYNGAEWLSLTQQGGEGGGDWTPPEGTIGDILYYTGSEVVEPTSRISVGETITIEGIEIDGDTVVLNNTVLAETYMTASAFEMDVDDLQVTADISFSVESPIIDLGGLVLENASVILRDPVVFQDYSLWSVTPEPDSPENGIMYYDESIGFRAYQAGAWHPMLVTEIENPFPIPADEHATVSYTAAEGWQPTSELLLDPDGAQFAGPIIIGEKPEEAPLVAGMIEYVNNDIQGILRHGDSYVRVSLTNILPSQILPDPDLNPNVIPYALNNEWVSSESFTYLAGVLSAPIVHLGSDELGGQITYSISADALRWCDAEGTWHNLTGTGGTVVVPGEIGSMLVSDGVEWSTAEGLSYISNVLSADGLQGHGLEIINIAEEAVASINSSGHIIGTRLEIGDIIISSLGISGVNSIQVEDLSVTTLRVDNLVVSDLPDTWAVETLNIGSFNFSVNEDDDLLLKYNALAIATVADTGEVTFNHDVTMPSLTIDGEVTFEYAITVGDEQYPGIKDTPGMIRYNGDFQGNLGNGRWASFTLSLADGSSGIGEDLLAPFGSGLYWNGEQWFRNDIFRIGEDGAICIGDTDTAYPGVIRFNESTENFEGCIQAGVWVPLTGIDVELPSLPTGSTDDSTLRWTGAYWVENPSLLSDGVMTWLNLLEIAPYENFYDNGFVSDFADVGESTVYIQGFSTAPTGIIQFSNHATEYQILTSTSEVMTIGQVGDLEHGLTNAVSEGITISIDGVLPRPEAAGGQIRYNQNDFEGFVENIGWVSFTGHLSVLPTRSGDTQLATGHGLYFDGEMWRAYHDIRMLDSSVEFDTDILVTGDLDVFGAGVFDSVRLVANDDVIAATGTIRFNSSVNRFEGCDVAQNWCALSSPILETAPLTDGDMLVYYEGDWINTSALAVRGSGESAYISIEPVDIHFNDKWLWRSRIIEVPVGEGLDSIQNVLSLVDNFEEEAYYINIFGDATGDEKPDPYIGVTLPISSTEGLNLGYEDGYLSEYLLDVNGTSILRGNTSIVGNITALGGTINGTLTVGNDLLVDDGDLVLLNGMVEAQSLHIYEEGFFGTTVRVGYKQGPAEIGAIRYSTPDNVGRGDWEGWDGEQWVSFTAGFHGQAIWGEPLEGDVVAFDGERWRPSQGMSIIDDTIYLGRTLLNGNDGINGEIRFTGTHAEVLINGSWITLNNGLPELPSGSSNGEIAYWYIDTWLPTDALLVTPEKIQVNSVLELSNYIETAPAAGGQVRYNQNDYEAYIEDIGWVSLTGHVPFQKPWEYPNQLLWSDGNNWVAYEGIDIDPLNGITSLVGSLEIAESIIAGSEIIAGDRITSGAGVVLAIDNDPTDHTLYADEQNRLRYDGSIIGYGENNCDDSIPRGAVYWEARQFRNSSSVRMMTRSI